MSSDPIRRSAEAHVRTSTDGHLVRRELVDNRRQIETLRDGFAPTPPISTAQAPEFDALSRDLARAVGPSEGTTDPMERAMSVLFNIQTMRHAFLPEAGKEAVSIEAELRADRQPVQPNLTDEERLQQRALNHLEE